MSQRSRVWWWIAYGAEGEEAEAHLQDLPFVPGWEQQLFVYLVGLRYSDIYTVNSPHAFTDLTSLSIVHVGEVNTSLLLTRWQAVQKCQPPPFHPSELRSLLADWGGTPCPFPRNRLLAFISFLKNKSSLCHSKRLLHGGQAPGTQGKSCSKCWAWNSPVPPPSQVPMASGQKAPWRGARRLQSGSFPCAAVAKVANTHGSGLSWEVLGVRDCLDQNVTKSD